MARRLVPRLNEAGPAGIHEPVQTGDNVVELHGDRESSAAPRSFDDLFLDHHDRLYRVLSLIPSLKIGAGRFILGWS